MVWSDAVLVAIDFENTGDILDEFLSSNDCQVGLAILDVRDLGRRNGLRPGRPIITAYKFVTGPHSYTNRASTKFGVGKSITIKPAAIRKRIGSVIPQDRHVGLVGHLVRNELEMLRNLGSKFAPSISVAIGSVRVTNEAFGSGAARSATYDVGHFALCGKRRELHVASFSTPIACKKCEGIIDQATLNI